MRRKRRGIEEEHDHPSELWLISYADMITVLFILMVILFAMSSLDSAKYEKMAESLQGVFDPNGERVTVTEVIQKEEEKTEKPVNEKLIKEQQELDLLEKQLKEYLLNKNLQQEVSVHNTSRGVEVVFQDLALFSSGSAQLSDKAQKTLLGIIPFLQKTDRSILIEGHTDNVPAKNSMFRDNFQLANERSLSVLYFLNDNKIKPNRLSSSGYGEFQPVADNKTLEGRAKNRRVNMVILRNFQLEKENK